MRRVGRFIPGSDSQRAPWPRTGCRCRTSRLRCRRRSAPACGRHRSRWAGWRARRRRQRRTAGRRRPAPRRGLRSTVRRRAPSRDHPGRRSTTMKSFPSPSTLVNGSAMTPAESLLCRRRRCRRLCGSGPVLALAPLRCPARPVSSAWRGRRILGGRRLLASRFFASGRGLGRWGRWGGRRGRCRRGRCGRAFVPASPPVPPVRPWPVGLLEFRFQLGGAVVVRLLQSTAFCSASRCSRRESC